MNRGSSTHRFAIILPSFTLLFTLGCHHNKPSNSTQDLDTSAESRRLVVPSEANQTRPESAQDSLDSVLSHQGFGHARLVRDKLTNALFLNCKINGISAILEVDTGFTFPCLWAHSLKKLHLTATESPFGIVAAGSAIQRSGLTQIERLEIGDLTAVSMKTLVADHGQLSVNAAERGEIDGDGVVGMTWLEAYSCVLDYGHDMLYFREPRSPKDLLAVQPTETSERQDDTARRESTEAGASENTLQLLTIGSVLHRNGYRFARLIRNEHSPDRYVDCSINGKTICLNVDTGAKQTVLAITLASDLKLALTKSSKVMYAIGGTYQIQTAPIHALQIGDTKPIEILQMPFVDYSARRAEAQKAGGVLYEGLLGADVLSAYSAVIDIEHGALYCQETPVPLALPQPDAPPIGGDYFKSLKGTWRATKIVREGKSEAVETVRSVSIVFDDGDCHVQVGDSKWLTTWILGNSARNSIDIYLLESSGNAKGMRLNGIYDIDKEQTNIRVCLVIDVRDEVKPTRSADGGMSINMVVNEFVPERPTKFESAREDKSVLIEFERSRS